ncbi:MAG: hypothetical protein WC823_04500 [Parcubacteria group bacterium]|jgi:hypothetical protein
MIDNKKIPTWLGTMIIIIFATTTGTVVWKIVINQGITRQSQEVASIKQPVAMEKPQTTQKDAEQNNDTTNPTSPGSSKQVNKYTNRTYGFEFEYPNKLITTSGSTDNGVILSDKQEGHWIYSINTTTNSKDLSLENAFNQILTENTKSVTNKKSIDVESIIMGGRPAKKYSIKNYNDYGNTGIILIHGKNIISIFGDDSILPINSDFQLILKSFRFTY